MSTVYVDGRHGDFPCKTFKPEFLFMFQQILGIAGNDVQKSLKVIPERFHFVWAKCQFGNPHI